MWAAASAVLGIEVLGPLALIGAPMIALEGSLGGVHITADSNAGQSVGPITPTMAQLATQNPTPSHPSLPSKLVQKVLNLEFIEMAELVPESWGIDPDPSWCCHQGRRLARRRPVTDILLWLESYSALVAALVAYQATIIKAYRNFEGMVCVIYH